MSGSTRRKEFSLWRPARPRPARSPARRTRTTTSSGLPSSACRTSSGSRPTPRTPSATATTSSPTSSGGRRMRAARAPSRGRTCCASGSPADARDTRRKRAAAREGGCRRNPLIRFKGYDASPVSETPKKLAKDLWRWTARHPEWHPGEFGKEVACFALRTGDDTVLIDPLLPPDPDPVLQLVEDNLGDRLSILVTIPYHVRSSEEIWQRFRKHAETTIHGHRACAKRLNKTSGFKELDPERSGLPAGITAQAIGKPRRHETPFHVPSHRALVFGDAVAEVDGKLVVWATD